MKSTLIFLSTSAAYASHSSFVCQDYGGLLTECKLHSVLLSSPIKEREKVYHTDYVVHYSFPCRGHSSLQIGVKTQSAYAFFKMGAKNKSLHLSGEGNLYAYDPNPSQTKRLSFRPGCQLQIERVTKFPSYSTLRHWNREATLLAEILAELIFQHSLAYNLEDIVSYSRSKLQSLRRTLNTLIAEDPQREYPETDDFLALLSVVEQLLHGTDVPQVLPDEIQNLLTQKILEKVQRKATEAEKLQSLFVKYHQSISKELEDVLQKIPQ